MISERENTIGGLESVMMSWLMNVLSGTASQLNESGGFKGAYYIPLSFLYVSPSLADWNWKVKFTWAYLLHCVPLTQYKTLCCSLPSKTCLVKPFLPQHASHRQANGIQVLLQSWLELCGLWALQRNKDVNRSYVIERFLLSACILMLSSFM